VLVEGAYSRRALSESVFGIDDERQSLVLDSHTA
jgi:hypothetical protein